MQAMLTRSFGLTSSALLILSGLFSQAALAQNQPASPNLPGTATPITTPPTPSKADNLGPALEIDVNENAGSVSPATTTSEIQLNSQRPSGAAATSGGVDSLFDQFLGSLESDEPSPSVPATQPPKPEVLFQGPQQNRGVGIIRVNTP